MAVQHVIVGRLSGEMTTRTIDVPTLDLDREIYVLLGDWPPEDWSAVPFYALVAGEQVTKDLSELEPSSSDWVSLWSSGHDWIARFGTGFMLCCPYAINKEVMTGPMTSMGLLRVWDGLTARDLRPGGFGLNDGTNTFFRTDYPSVIGGDDSEGGIYFSAYEGGFGGARIVTLRKGDFYAEELGQLGLVFSETVATVVRKRAWVDWIKGAPDAEMSIILHPASGADKKMSAIDIMKLLKEDRSDSWLGGEGSGLGPPIVSAVDNSRVAVVAWFQKSSGPEQYVACGVVDLATQKVISIQRETDSEIYIYNTTLIFQNRAGGVTAVFDIQGHTDLVRRTVGYYFSASEVTKLGTLPNTFSLSDDILGYL